MCREVTLCLMGGSKAACLLCLKDEGSQPTGHLLPWLYHLVDHLSDCTSHSSSLTPEHLDALSTARTSSRTLRDKMYPSNSTSSKAQTRKKTQPQQQVLFSGTRQSNSASPPPKPRAFSIPKKSN